MEHPLSRLVAASRPMDPAVVEARRKFAQALEDDVFDYKHHSADHIERAVTTLLRIFRNVTDTPSEEKYRKVKSTSKVLTNDVKSFKGGEHLLILAGWKQLVVECQKYWVFDAEEDGTRFRILQAVVGVLEHALSRIHVKAEKERREVAGKKDAQRALREQILLQLEDDKVERRIKAMTHPVLAPESGDAQEHATQPAAAAGHSEQSVDGIVHE